MLKDLSRARAEFKGEKIVTKHEWIIAALELLEKDLPIKREESP
jgi:hypothetical protein